MKIECSESSTEKEQQFRLCSIRTETNDKDEEQEDDDDETDDDNSPTHSVDKMLSMAINHFYLARFWILIERRRSLLFFFLFVFLQIKIISLKMFSFKPFSTLSSAAKWRRYPKVRLLWPCSGFEQRWTPAQNDSFEVHGSKNIETAHLNHLNHLWIACILSNKYKTVTMDNTRYTKFGNNYETTGKENTSKWDEEKKNRRKLNIRQTNI